MAQSGHYQKADKPRPFSGRNFEPWLSPIMLILPSQAASTSPPVFGESSGRWQSLHSASQEQGVLKGVGKHEEKLIFAEHGLIKTMHRGV